MHKLHPSWNLIFRWGVVLIFSCFVIVFQVYPQNTITNDFSSLLIHVDSWKESKTTYSSYFDIKPPGLQILLISWDYVFGSSMYSWLALYSLCGIIITIACLSFLRLYVRNEIFLYCSFTWVFLFSIYNEIGRNFLNADYIGIALVLLGFTILILNRSLLCISISSFFIFAAGTIKEVFFLCPILLFPLIKKSNFFQVIISIFTGGVLAYLPLYLFLEFSSQLGTYRQILDFKGRLFGVSLSDFVGNNLPDVFGFLLNDPSIVSLALFILGFGFFTNGQVSKIFAGDSGLPIRSLCLMIATIILGLAIQGKDVSGHYLLAISPPLLMILIALISKVTMPASKYSFPLVLFAVCLLTFHGKDSSVTLQNPNRYLHWILEIENPPSLIKYQLPDNDCMQVIYGWDAGSYYHYSKNKACSKYFLVSLIQKDAISLDLYKRDLSQNPPPLVYYQTKGADIDVVEFESRVLNWSRVLESCYTQLDNGVYALDGSRVESRVCFKNSM